MEKADVLDMTVQYLKACKARKANGKALSCFVQLLQSDSSFFDAL